MATPNYEVDYNDSRFTEVEADKQAALNEVDVTYGDMISNSDKFYEQQIADVEAYGSEQAKIQNQQTDFAIQQIKQQKEQAKQDYLKEQSGAYVDWQKQSNQYGANAEQMAAQGMTNTGYSESSQVSMYNTYQNRVATAREAINRAYLEYDNMMKEARLQNSAALAEIAYNTLLKKNELALSGFQYKNELVLAKASEKRAVDEMYHGYWKDVLNQINTENSLAETVRQYNENMAFKEKEYQEGVRQFNAQLAEQKRQFNATHSGGSGGGGGSGGAIKKSTSKSGAKTATIGKVGVDITKKSPTKKSNAGKVVNRHGDSWVEIPGHGRFSWSEVESYVWDGTIEAKTLDDGSFKYVWVGKKAKNVTPDKKGYAAKQKELFGY